MTTLKRFQIFDRDGREVFENRPLRDGEVMRFANVAFMDAVQHAVALDAASRNDGLSEVYQYQLHQLPVTEEEHERQSRQVEKYNERIGAMWKSPSDQVATEPFGTPEEAYAKYENRITNAWRR